MLHIFLFICFCFIACIICFIYFTVVKIKMGVPPVKRMLIAYKYSYRNHKHSSDFKELRILFPNSNLIKLCYCGVKADHIEYANGVILRENSINIDSALLEATFRKGFSLFIIPEITYSVFTDVPVRQWLPLSYVMAIALSYPRLFSFIQKNRLCGYPVLEVYKKSSLSVIVPLIRQDEFVVTEAMNVVNGYKYSSLLRPYNSLSHINFKNDGQAEGVNIKKRNALKQKG